MRPPIEALAQGEPGAARPRTPAGYLFEEETRERLTVSQGFCFSVILTVQAGKPMTVEGEGSLGLPEMPVGRADRGRHPVCVLLHPNIPAGGSGRAAGGDGGHFRTARPT